MRTCRAFVTRPFVTRLPTRWCDRTLYGSLRDPRSAPSCGSLKWNEHVPGSFVENGPFPHPRSPLHLVPPEAERAMADDEKAKLYRRISSANIHLVLARMRVHGFWPAG